METRETDKLVYYALNCEPAQSSIFARSLKDQNILVRYFIRQVQFDHGLLEEFKGNLHLTSWLDISTANA